MARAERLRSLVSRQYGAEAAVPVLLSGGEERCIYRLRRADGPDWVVRAYPADWQRARDRAALLLFLERAGFPGPRLVRTTDGGLVATQGAWQILVTRFVTGEALGYAPPRLRLLGATLGRLHALNRTEAFNADPPVAMAEWRPATQVPPALAHLASVTAMVPPALRAPYEVLTASLNSIGDSPELPVAIIHTDPFPGNAVYTATGEAVLVDWDEAGLGPAMVDLGYLLITCDAGRSWSPRLRPDPARIAAVVDGYRAWRLPSEVELTALPELVRFGPAVNAAWALAAAVATPNGDAEADWRRWARLEAATETSSLAIERFERQR